MGDLFDQYQVYRPEIIKQWNEGASLDDPDHSWQQYLWVRAKKEAGNALPDKTMVSNADIGEVETARLSGTAEGPPAARTIVWLVDHHSLSRANTV